MKCLASALIIFSRRYITNQFEQDRTKHQLSSTDSGSIDRVKFV